MIAVYLRSSWHTFLLATPTGPALTLGPPPVAGAGSDVGAHLWDVAVVGHSTRVIRSRLLNCDLVANALDGGVGLVSAGLSPRSSHWAVVPYRERADFVVHNCAVGLVLTARPISAVHPLGPSLEPYAGLPAQHWSIVLAEV